MSFGKDTVNDVFDAGDQLVQFKTNLLSGLVGNISSVINSLHEKAPNKKSNKRTMDLLTASFTSVKNTVSHIEEIVQNTQNDTIDSLQVLSENNKKSLSSITNSLIKSIQKDSNSSAKALNCSSGK
jgi:hypothetical protein